MKPSSALRWLPVVVSLAFLGLAVLALVDDRGIAWAVAFLIGALGAGVATVPAFARRRKAPSVQ